MLILINNLIDFSNNDLYKFVLRLRLSYAMKLYCSMPYIHTFFLIYVYMLNHPQGITFGIYHYTQPFAVYYK